MKVNNAFIYGLILIATLVFLSYLVAVRDLSIGTDSQVYKWVFYLNLGGEYTGRFEPGFLLFMSLAGAVFESYEFFLFSSSFFLIISSFYVLHYLAEKDGLYLVRKESLFVLLFSFILLSPFFFSLQVNIIRHGLAAPFLVMSFIFFDERKYLRFFIFGALSISFHWSAGYFLVIAPLLRLRLRTLMLITAMLSVSYISNFSGMLLGSLMTIAGLDQLYDSAISYGQNSAYRSGVRFDLWLFSIFFLAVSFVVGNKLNLGGRIFRYCLVLFLPFLLIGFIAFSDRVLVFLWFLIPLILCSGVALIYRKVDKYLAFCSSFFFFVVAVFVSILRLT